MTAGGNVSSLPRVVDNHNNNLYYGSVVAVLASAFLNLLGFTMAGPITPALGQHFGLTVGASFGSLTSAYPLGMLLGLFVWPSLSDRIGRKPVMMMTLLGSAGGLWCQSAVVRQQASLRWFLVTRVLTGCFAGASPVSKAYLADIPSTKLARFLSWREAASTMAFIVGPVLGGLVCHNQELSFVIAISAAASLIASLSIALFVKEPPKKNNNNNNKSNNNNNIQQQQQHDYHLSCPLGNRLWAGVTTICVVSFLFHVGDATFHAFFSALLKESLLLDAKAIGMTYTSLACVSLFMSTFVTGTLMQTLGPVASCAGGLGLAGLGLCGLASARAVSSALYYCGVPLYGPAIPTMLLRCVPPNRRGAVMGGNGAINTVARVLAPLFMGELYRRYGPSLTFGVASLSCLTGSIITILRYKKHNTNPQPP